MPTALDACYLGGLIAAAPVLAYRAVTTGKYRHGWPARLLGSTPPRPDGRPTVWFHGVSVGEIVMLRGLIAAFRARHPGWRVVVSSTTDTGLAEAERRLSDVPRLRFPLDFSWAVQRTLDAVRPDLIVLAEGELWPHFLGAAARRGVPVAVVNGRFSPRTAARYRRLARLAQPMLRSVAAFAMQTPAYAEAVRSLGVPSERVSVTGSIKYDNAPTDRDQPRTRELAELFAVRPGQRLFIAGSTQAPEEELALAAFRTLHDVPNVRLMIVPRQRERFDEVAALLTRANVPFVRRSALRSPTDSAVILMDTIGELSALWGLADVAFVGGSFDGQRGGQSMIEPAGYGAAIVYGPHTWNFRDTVERLREVGGALALTRADELAPTVRRLMLDESERRRLGTAAQALVRSQQGATERTLDVLERLLLVDNGGSRRNETSAP